MEGYSKLPGFSELHHQRPLSVILRTPKFWGILTHSRRYSYGCIYDIAPLNVQILISFTIFGRSLAMILKHANRGQWLICRCYSCWRGCPGGVMVKAMDCGIVVSEFVLQSRYYVHFRTNTLGKGMNPFILPGMG